MRTGYEVDPSFQYGLEDFPAGHVVVKAYDDVRREMDADPFPGDNDLTDGKHYLDGRPLYSAMATANRPHLYQHKYDGVQSYVMQGSEFPPEAFGEKSDVEASKEVAIVDAPPPEKASVNSGLGIRVIERQRPPLKTPMLVAGALVGIGVSGGIYYSAVSSRSSFDLATTREEVDSYRQKTNALLMASGASVAVGAGFYAFGVSLDGDGILFPRIGGSF